MTGLAAMDHEIVNARRQLALWLEIAVFVALSIAIHLALVSRPPQDGAEGSAGERAIAFETASSALAGLVESWSEPLATPSAPEPLTTPNLAINDLVQSRALGPVALRSPSPEPVRDRSTAPRHGETLPTAPDPTGLHTVPSIMPRNPLSEDAPDAIAGQPSAPFSTPLQPDKLTGPSPPGEPPPTVPDPPEASDSAATESAPLPTPRTVGQTARRTLSDRDRNTPPAKSSLRSAPEAASRPQPAKLGGAPAPDRHSPPVRAMTPGPSETERQSLLHALGARVLAAIAQERHYPRQALRRRVEGTVTLEVTIDRSGGLMNLSVRRSSGQRILDDAASNAARAVHRFPQAPDELPGGPFTFAIPVRFAIR